MLRSKSICNEISVFFHSYFLFSKLWFICKRPKVNMGWYKELRDKSKYINKDIHVFQMKTAHIESVANRQSRRCCVGIPMDISTILYVVMTQRCKRCTFYSPGLASDSEVYPGSFVVSGDNAVGVVPFIPRCFIAAFHTEKAQHLRRWPPHYMHNPRVGWRQLWAITRTTPSALN